MTAQKASECFRRAAELTSDAAGELAAGINALGRVPDELIGVLVVLQRISDDCVDAGVEADRAKRRPVGRQLNGVCDAGFKQEA